MRLENNLILNRYILYVLGFDNLEEVKTLLYHVPEGPGDGGQSNFFGRLATQPGLNLTRDQLADYDRRVIEYERRLVHARTEFSGFRYFQYLALLFTEIFLDRLTNSPQILVDDLNSFLDRLREDEPDLGGFSDFSPRDLRRFAFFMATGSGKTLIMHVNIWQVLYYLKKALHPDTLVSRADKRRLFDNVLLITPNEGLSAQHIDELRQSGHNAGLFIEDPQGRGDMFGVKVKVIEIHKLAEEPSKDGVSVVLGDLGANNFVIVDEGHKGTGSEARKWKNRQQRLSRNGFLMEYSATFAQAIGAASRKTQLSLVQEYGKSILFDYSYAYFFGDGYGKNFNVLNLSRARAIRAHELLVGGLLTFYNQINLFQTNWIEYRKFNIDRPLWVLLGSSVNALYTRGHKRRSDVAEVIAFLRHFIEEPDWAEETISRILDGNSGFEDHESGNDLFAPHVDELHNRKPDLVYGSILKDVFHGSGALEIWEIKNSEGEFGLRLSSRGSDAQPYFGIINIGDASSFKRYLNDHLGINVLEDRIAGSQFDEVNQPDSQINILIGAKKFIEGWSSWRVSSMGLLNVGKGEGSQVIQLFGRGVRLKGKDMTLKRTEALEDASRDDINRNFRLETLYIFGWNADYIGTFRNMLEKEDIGRDFTIPVKLHEPWPGQNLPIPKKKRGFNLKRLTWRLSTDNPPVVYDATPRIMTYVGEDRKAIYGIGEEGTSCEQSFDNEQYFNILNIHEIYQELLLYKQIRGYNNLFIAFDAVKDIIRNRCKVRLYGDDVKSPEHIQEAATHAIKMYLDRYVRRKEREAEFENSEPGYLNKDEQITTHYKVKIKKSRFLREVEEMLKRPVSELEYILQQEQTNEPLPRLHIQNHLFNPVLISGGSAWNQAVSISPPALNKDERKVLDDIRKFWRDNNSVEPFKDYVIYILRNLPKSGVGLFAQSGFYPDFIIWFKNSKTDRIHIRFLDPHGLHHDGLSGSADKFSALEKLKEFSSRRDFEQKKISLDGFILSATPLEQIKDSGDMCWDDIERKYPVRHCGGDYVRKLLVV